MVSLWPWKKDDSSPASFEKTLSTLSTKIANTQASLERARSSARRVRVLSTLYLSFGYLVYAIVALVVVGWKNMGAYEWSGMAGGPVLIYLVRTISSTIHDLRIESLSTRLKDQQAERAKTIQKLKDATRYDSTLELLEKYGGGEVRPKGKKKSADDTMQDDGSKKSPGSKQRQKTGTPNRTTIPPPPTANIQRHNIPSPNQGMPQQAGPFLSGPPLQQRVASPGQNEPADVSAEFSPNAFDGSRPAAPQGVAGQGQYEPHNHWYDRIMDLLLGEDETASKNRIVLICKQCRLVNGQAPPGTNSLAELGMWKCMACGAMNGEVDEGKRLVKEVLGAQIRGKQGGSTDGVQDDGESSDLVEVQSAGTRTDEDVSVISAREEEEEEKEETQSVKRRKGKGKE